MRLTVCVVAMGVALGASALVPSDADAVIVCQHPKRTNRVRLEAGPECKDKKWKKVDDLDAFATVSDVNAALASLLASQVQVGDELGTTCGLDPNRTLAPSTTGGGPPHGCRKFDGQETACLGAFEVVDGTPTSCWYYGGQCLGCELQYAQNFACINTCSSLCEEAPSRQRVKRCGDANNQTACEQSFKYPRFFTLAGPESCWWDAQGTPTCYPCTSDDTARHSCTNACNPPVVCASRTDGPLACFDAMTQLDCEKRFTLVNGIPTTCYWGGATCGTCSIPSQFVQGFCTNDC
ncbi:MAG TPA: hypothetical protein VMS22_12285 [Candidatus Eisenbacteria bacterium]|nr:hypothetical protein [Candidatus Eisenbacteria bacterium]